MPTTLIPIHDENLRDVLALKTTDAQQRFVAPVHISLAQAALSAHAWFRAIAHTDDDDPPSLVGFVMLHLEEPRVVHVWRLLVDHRFQQRGIGRSAMQAVVERARSWGAERVALSYLPGEGDPGGFYAKLGFVETGEVDEGERVMVLDLEGGADARGEASRRYTESATALSEAARHARVAAEHLGAGEVPRACAHALAARGHVLEATTVLDDLARLHARLAD